MKTISLTPYLFIVLFIALLFMLLFESAAQDTPSHYMLLYNGANGLNFYCLDELPYVETRPMVWDDELGATEINEQGILKAQIVQVDECYLDNVYIDPTSNELYVFRFTSHDTDGHPTHRHLTRGISWVNWTH